MNDKVMRYLENLICDWNNSMCGEIDCQCDDCKCAEEHIEYLKQLIAAWNTRAAKDSVWCRDCKYYYKEHCVNGSSEWCTEPRGEFDSCQNCEPKGE